MTLDEEEALRREMRALMRAREYQRQHPQAWWIDRKAGDEG